MSQPKEGRHWREVTKVIYCFFFACRLHALYVQLPDFTLINDDHWT